MMQFSVTVEIQASPERVWSVMRDVERWREWTPSVKSIKRFGKGPIGAGSRLLIRQPKLPAAMWKVMKIEEGKGFISFSGIPFLLEVTAQHSIEKTGGGSKVTLAVQYAGLFGSLFGQMTRDLNERYLGFEANGLKQRCESTIQHE